MKFAKIAGVFTVSALMIFPAHGQDVAEKGEVCSRVEDSLQRLSCFDRAFPRGAAGKVVTPDVETGIVEDGWDIESTKSAIDDSPSVVAILEPHDVSGTGIGESYMGLIVRCTENTTSVVLGTSMFMTGDTARVTVRVDDAPASSSAWPISTSYKAVGLWTGSKAIPFIKSIAEAEKLVVRVEAKDRIDAQFALGDVKSVAEQISAACNWAL